MVPGPDVPALRRAVNRRIIEQAIHECIAPHILAHMLVDVQIEYDAPSDKHVVIGALWRSRDGWQNIRTRSAYVRHPVRLSIGSQFQKTAADPTSGLKGLLSARSELHHFRLNQHFPKRVKEVRVKMNELTREPIVTVCFLNGHMLQRPENEIMTTEFLALCAMVYDLPAKEP
jgi:hypothetical protein